ncbi:MAG TPA: 5-formyltetrahydrofolate cyclo-ligase [Candidatus Saccharimonadales bacterium]|nr:5-formyltetrahydrofolate cyclo-ligase [Candidatus Saccharimonadales bacterium]
MTETKADIRRRLLEERKKLSTANRSRKNQQITQKFIEFSIAKRLDSLNSVHIFEPIKSLGEVDTGLVTAYISQTWPRATIYHPRKISSSWVDVDEQGKVADVKSYDLIIVPTLAFDDRLNRLGYGGGYYDKFLTIQKSAYTVGLCFELGHVSQLPIEPHDVALEALISEQQIYTNYGS